MALQFADRRRLERPAEEPRRLSGPGAHPRRSRRVDSWTAAAPESRCAASPAAATGRRTTPPTRGTLREFLQPFDAAAGRQPRSR